MAYSWASYYEKNKERIKARRRQRYVENKDAENNQSRSWYAHNKDKKKAYDKARDREELKQKNRRYYAKNRDKMLAAARKWKSDHKDAVSASFKIWRANNRARLAFHQRTREAVKLQAMPQWVSKDAIRSVYEQSAAKTISTGIKHHVDHIWPLRGEGFSGLHVPWNLQVLTASENCRKHNKRPS